MVLTSVVVLVDGFEPTDIVVRVRDQMDVDFFYIYGVASLEMLMEALFLFLMGLTWQVAGLGCLLLGLGAANARFNNTKQIKSLVRIFGSKI
jgi:hypothetical protein